MSGRAVRYEGNLRLIVRALRKASEQKDPSLEVYKDEGWKVVSMMAENDRLGEQGGYTRNWRGSCLGDWPREEIKCMEYTYQSLG